MVIKSNRPARFFERPTDPRRTQIPDNDPEELNSEEEDEEVGKNKDEEDLGYEARSCSADCCDKDCECDDCARCADGEFSAGEENDFEAAAA